ncbi:hypothetical protein M8C21_005071 [Ambrosia artemisiifolia]|uniref:Uncharacterized protein n=1 Tax=Ambrosia artemisiifolia TaxID=4212 RepID=A0AAD5GAJ9_AMBAR|nr:hypothetical protein M8C21_005071 [Ambrosia artemisiifolia]
MQKNKRRFGAINLMEKINSNLVCGCRKSFCIAGFWDNRLQEAILTIPHAITRLVDMLMDREVIRNEALLLLTYLTREAEEI